MLYTRQILILFVNLYTVRIVLNTLGVVDYGIFNVIGGIVALFTFLSGTMASATQRFFSFALGKKNIDKLKEVFSVNLVIYLFIAVIALIALETIGLWFVTNKLHVPFDRVDTAILLYHFSVFTFICTIFIAPLMSILIAHEDMHIYAYISIVEVSLKLLVAISLYFIPWDKLQLYGFLLFIVSTVNLSTYLYVCIRKYPECQLKKIYWNKKLFSEIVGFTGWTLFGQITTVIRKQAITILLNQTFNPVVVASRAIAMNVSNQIRIFSNNFNVGLSPSIIKSYAANNKTEMFNLIYNGSKITFFLMWVFSLPVILEMESILKYWLKNPPPAAVLFTQLSIVEVLLHSVSLPIATAARAPGKMKLYELCLGAIQILIFLVSWILIANGFKAYSVFYVAIIANILMFFLRLILVKKLINLQLITFTKYVFIPLLLIVVISFIPSYFIHIHLPSGFIYLIIKVFLMILISTICMYFIGLNKKTRDQLANQISNKVKSLLGKKKLV